jgi:hypothetical protein
MTTTTTLTTSAADAREAARLTDGRFGEQEHSAPDEGLTSTWGRFGRDSSPADADDSSGSGRDEGDGEWTLTREESAVMLGEIQKMAKQYGYRYDLQAADRDDVVQDTILDVLGQHKRRSAAGKDTSYLLGGAFLNTATRAVSQRALLPDVHHTTRTGRTMFAAARAEREQELGRELSKREADELAETVRLGFEPGRRPTAGYHRVQTPVSLETPIGDGEATLGDFVPAPDDAPLTASKAAGALDDIDDADGALLDATGEARQEALKAREAAREAARGDVWGLVSGDAPQPVPNRVTDPHAVRQRVAALGGAAAMARAWEAGDLSLEDEAVLFAPFDTKTARDSAEVAAVLSRYSDYADELFHAAVTASTDPAADEAARKARRAAARRRQRAAAKAAA